MKRTIISLFVAISLLLLPAAQKSIQASDNTTTAAVISASAIPVAFIAAILINVFTNKLSEGSRPYAQAELDKMQAEQELERQKKIDEFKAKNPNFLPLAAAAGQGAQGENIKLKKIKEKETMSTVTALQAQIQRYIGKNNGRKPQSLTSGDFAQELGMMPKDSVTGINMVNEIDGMPSYDLSSKAEPSFINGDGGWVYFPATGEIFLNITGPDSNGNPYWKYGK